VVVARSYTYELTVRRMVALDGDFTCRNCGFASPYRVFGQGEAKRHKTQGATMWENAKPITEIPSGLKAEAHKEAEARAWDRARALTQQVVCPRCTRGQVPPFLQFAVR
jgi:hypothetical protein